MESRINTFQESFLVEVAPRRERLHQILKGHETPRILVSDLDF